MITRSLMWITEQIKGRLSGEDCIVSAVSTDTRTLTQGAVYLALKGENFDGHQFVEAAEAAGACLHCAARGRERWVQRLRRDVRRVVWRDV